MEFTSRILVGSALLCAALAAGTSTLVACVGDDPVVGAGNPADASTATSSSSSGAPSSSSSSGSGTSGETTSSSGESPSSSSSSSGDAGTECVPTDLTVGAFTRTDFSADEGGSARYWAAPSPAPAGGESTLSVELYDNAVLGTHDLGLEQNYRDCTHCVSVSTDAGARFFFQKSGRIELLSGTPFADGSLVASLSDVIVVESTRDPATFTSTPVAGGRCYRIVQAALDVAP